MESDVSFNLEGRVNDWVNSIKLDPAITEADAEELRTHFFDQIDDLKKAGLNDKEAFMVASNRMNVNDDVATEYRELNNNLIQTKRTMIILGGVLFFLFFYYLIKDISKLLLIITYLFSDSNKFMALNFFERSLISWHFIFILFISSLFVFEKRVIRIIEKVRLKPKYTIIILILAFIFEMIELILHAKCKGLLRDSDNPYFLDKFIHDDIYFGISFPMLICIGFIFIYFKYYKKTKI